MYSRYEDIKWNYEIPELKSSLIRAGGKIEFANENMPLILANTIDGPCDIMISSVMIDRVGSVVLYGIRNNDIFGNIEMYLCCDIEYGHLNIVRMAIDSILQDLQKVV